MDSKIIAIISIFVNLVLTGLKLAVGFLVGSAAIIAEAINSGLDIISSAITFIGIKVGQKPADKEHPYGHYRYESVAGIFVSSLIFVSAVWIIYEGISRLVSGQSMIFSYWALGLMMGTAVVNEIMSRLKFFYGRKFESLALVADAEHSRLDVISALGVLAGLAIAKFYPVADSLTAIVVGLFVLYQVCKLIRELADSFMDISDPETEVEIRKIASRERITVAELKTRKIGSAIFADIHIDLDPKLKVEEASAVTADFENKLLNEITKLKQVMIAVSSHSISRGIRVSAFGKRLRWSASGRPGGSDHCVCPKCGNRKIHQRGIPCKEEICQKCGSPMKGESYAEAKEM